MGFSIAEKESVLILTGVPLDIALFIVSSKPKTISFGTAASGLRQLINEPEGIVIAKLLTLAPGKMSDIELICIIVCSFKVYSDGSGLAGSNLLGSVIIRSFEV